MQHLFLPAEVQRVFVVEVSVVSPVSELLQEASAYKTETHTHTKDVYSSTAMQLVNTLRHVIF